jgi:hypothetical protein
MIEGTSDPFGRIGLANVACRIDIEGFTPGRSPAVSHDWSSESHAAAIHGTQAHLYGGTNDECGKGAVKSLKNLSIETLRSQSSLRVTNSGFQPEALVFSTNFRPGFDVEEFQTVLPKNYIHHVLPGDMLHDFFAAWKRATAETVPANVYGLRQ